MSDRLHAVGMSRLEAFDEEFRPDPVAVVHGRRRRIMQHLGTLTAVVISAGAVAVWRWLGRSSIGHCA